MNFEKIVTDMSLDDAIKVETLIRCRLRNELSKDALKKILPEEFETLRKLILECHSKEKSDDDISEINSDGEIMTSSFSNGVIHFPNIYQKDLFPLERRNNDGEIFGYAIVNWEDAERISKEIKHMFSSSFLNKYYPYHPYYP